MIARTWRGWVRTAQAQASVESIAGSGLRGRAATPGNLGNVAACSTSTE